LLKIFDVVKSLYRKINRRIKVYDDKEDGYRLIDWLLQGDIPKIESINNSIHTDFRRIAKWQHPSIRFYYTGRDLLEEPKWEPGERGFMEPFWWPLVYILIIIITFGLIWGFMNCVGF
jgi:hypothetical protein